MDIGERIRNRRIELNLGVDDLAQKLGKNRATIYRYENGDIENMPIAVIEPLAKALQTTPAYLTGWSSEKRPKLQDKLEQFIDLLTASTGVSFFNENASEDKSKSFGERVKKARQDAGLSQHELAMLAGYTSRSSIGKIESGKRDIARNKIAVIAKITGVTTSYLIDGESFLEVDIKTREAILMSLKSTLALSQCLSENEEKQHD